MIDRRIRQDLSMSELHAYYEEFQIESDAYANLDDVEDDLPIRIDIVRPEDVFYLSAREARVLAWSLLEAADKADRERIS